ncbi:hypothetical protein KUV51_14590 [Tateyamaria omphalii]|uniref:hypothetical protein n=1 Tax=Tateyamaria omphalii TaxID=299262 RepID=UPI001C99DEB5|nr:hypothetical protein [Tateyamaria omphalii]MBY5934234.1 hypothetical protein [Tateyamaria omphalii]
MLLRHTDPARHARILERRAARARRSKWLGRVIFSMTGFGLLMILRMNPGIVEDVVALAHDVPPRTQDSSFEAPSDVHVRRMPTDAVPVRRLGSSAPGQTEQVDIQAQADDVANTLRALTPGGG